jgi:diguanylate cyclase (GGDEF)-like protein
VEGVVTGGIGSSPLAGQPRETGGVTSALLLAYLDRTGGPEAVAAVLGRCGLAGCESELRDENCWFSWDTKIALFEATAAVLDRPDFLEEMASLTMELGVGSGLKVALRTLGSPQLVYRSIVRANARFNGSHAMELLGIDRGTACIRFAGIGDESRFHPLDCHYSAAMLRVVPELFGLPRAELRHRTCVGHGDASCVYDLSWREHISSGRRALAAGAGTIAALGASVLLAPALLPVAIGVSVVGSGSVVLSELRRHREAWLALQREAEDNAEVVQRLFASLEDLVSDLRLEEVLGKVTRNAQAAVGGREFALLLREGERLVCQSSSNLPARTVAALEAWATATVRVAEQAVVLDDVRDVPALEPLLEKTMPLSSLASAPLTFFGESFGVLIALGTQAHTFLPRDVEVLQSFATQVSIAINNAQRYHLTKTQADADSLTGLLNHRCFHEALERRLAPPPAERAGCVALVDLDNFKAVNDDDGHSAGDRLLQAAARELTGACRGDDLAFRVGGDEFALLLPGLEERAADAVVSHVCSAISALDPRLGASAGVAALAAAADKADVLKLADDRLYAAKRKHGANVRRRASEHPATIHPEAA